MFKPKHMTKDEYKYDSLFSMAEYDGCIIRSFVLGVGLTSIVFSFILNKQYIEAFTLTVGFIILIPLLFFLSKKAGDNIIDNINEKHKELIIISNPSSKPNPYYQKWMEAFDKREVKWFISEDVLKEWNTDDN